MADNAWQSPAAYYRGKNRQDHHEYASTRGSDLQELMTGKKGQARASAAHGILSFPEKTVLSNRGTPAQKPLLLVRKANYSNCRFCRYKQDKPLFWTINKICLRQNSFPAEGPRSSTETGLRCRYRPNTLTGRTPG